MNNRTDLNVGEVVYISIIFHIPVSWLYLLNGHKIYFLMASHKLDQPLIFNFIMPSINKLALARVRMLSTSVKTVNHFWPPVVLNTLLLFREFCFNTSQLWVKRWVLFRPVQFLSYITHFDTKESVRFSLKRFVFQSQPLVAWENVC